MGKLEQETRNRIDDIDKINDTISKEHQNNLKVDNQIKDLSTSLASEKKERDELKEKWEKKLDDGIQSINDNLNSLEGDLKAEMKNEYDLRLKDKQDLDNLQKATLEDQNNLRYLISQETKNRNDECSKINA